MYVSSQGGKDSETGGLFDSCVIGSDGALRVIVRLCLECVGCRSLEETGKTVGMTSGFSIEGFSKPDGLRFQSEVKCVLHKTECLVGVQFFHFTLAIHF